MEKVSKEVKEIMQKMRLAIWQDVVALNIMCQQYNIGGAMQPLNRIQDDLAKLKTEIQES